MNFNGAMDLHTKLEVVSSSYYTAIECPRFLSPANCGKALWDTSFLEQIVEHLASQIQTERFLFNVQLLWSCDYGKVTIFTKDGIL